MSDQYLYRKIFGSVCFSRYKPTFSAELGYKLVASAEKPEDWDRTWRMYAIPLERMGFRCTTKDKRIYHYKDISVEHVGEISEIKIKNFDHLLDFQIDHTKRIIRALKKFDTAFDGSDTGTGKTYVTCAVAKELDLRLFVVCPKSLISSWWRVIDEFGIKAVSVTNYELLKMGKFLRRVSSKSRNFTPILKRITEKDTQKSLTGSNASNSKKKNASNKFDVPKGDINSPQFRYEQASATFIQINENPGYGNVNQYFEWHLKPSVLVVFDEVQRCKNRDTLNNKLLIGAKHSGMKILMLSATIASSPNQMSGTAYALGLYPKYTDFAKWVDYHKEQAHLSYARNKSLAIMEALHDEIFPLRGSRMRIEALGNLFPEYKIVVEPLDMGKNAEKIQEIYEDLNQQIAQLKKEEKKQAHILGKIIKARQMIELYKIPTIVELANDIVDAENSCVIFVNFNQTMDILLEKLETKCCIRGGQKQQVRDAYIESFVSNESPIIVANIQAGGVGISLHDTQDLRPRISLINPSFNAMDLKQAIGRVRRVGGGYSVNRVLICGETIEENICENIRKKLNAINTLNDRDFTDWFSY
jgi:Mimiviridae putative ATP-dependent RNA helicase